jgi:hypothetical protein
LSYALRRFYDFVGASFFQRIFARHAAEFRVMLHQEPVHGPRVSAKALEQLRESPERLAVAPHLPRREAKAARCAFKPENLVLTPPSVDRRARGSKPRRERIGTQHLRAGEDFRNAQLSATACVGKRSVQLRMTRVGMTGTSEPRGVLSESGDTLHPVRSDTDDEAYFFPGLPAELDRPGVCSLDRR